MNFFITGAGRGIGLEFVRQILGAGHHVFAGVRTPTKATALLELKEKNPEQLTLLTLDVGDEESIKKAAGLVEAHSIDVLINNAGVLMDQSMSLESVTIDALNRSFQTNSVGPLLVTRNLLGLLQAAPSPVVANITSLMGSVDDNSSGGYYAYRMSKTALNMFTKGFSLDFPDIRILSLHPGWVKTDMGGSGAPITTEESVGGLLKVILDGKFHSGGFFDFRGQALEW